MIDISLKRFGRLVALTCESRRNKSGVMCCHWLCVCDCGAKTTVFSNNLRRGLTKSCGCLRAEVSAKRMTKHGEYGSKAYRSWAHMLGRCNNSNDKKYKDYGGRGISVYRQWFDFSKFLSDMGPCPKEMSIDRIDNDGNYEPGNCRWATQKTQQNNRRTNRLVSYNGDTLTVSQWAIKLKINYGSLLSRLDRGWSIERALTTKINIQYRKCSPT